MPEKKINVLGVNVDALSWDEAVQRLTFLASSACGGYVSICNSHSIVTAGDDETFRDILNKSAMVTADGAPVAWLMRRLGHKTQARINGPDFFWRYCASAAAREEPIYLYGGKHEVLIKLENRLRESFPGLLIAGAYSPPYREFAVLEDSEVIESINRSGAKTIWVSLGCPKQEKWMAIHEKYFAATMVGVGAAFDYHALTLRRAPRWMQDAGLEWFYRLCQEPRRLFKRYFLTNFKFMARSFVLLCKH